MAIKQAPYRSFQFKLGNFPAGTQNVYPLAVPSNVLFKSSKPNGAPSLWTIIAQYDNIDPTNAIIPVAPATFAGVTLTVVGNISGAGGIQNIQSIGQKCIPIRGGVYQVFGTEIAVGLAIVNAAEKLIVGITAIEDCPLFNGCDTETANATILILIPNYTTSYNADCVGQFVSQLDVFGAALKNNNITALDMWVPLDTRAAFVKCGGAIEDTVYSFKKGYV